ncbi:MAG: twin-arginine translocation signal domain-containing protein, partial [Planctomycetes bacterium]|nr:twin-arginine translocation signal domain-containing protein [Planctomycetota bacterium]
MSKITRRGFVKTMAVAGAGMSIPGCSKGYKPHSRIIGANDEVRIGIVGFNSHGKSHIKRYQAIPKGVRIVALCDPDTGVISRGLKEFFNGRADKVDTYADIRQLLDRKDIDAIS